MQSSYQRSRLPYHLIICLSSVVCLLGACGGAKLVPEDQDKDGIINSEDRCPKVPEDMDGFEDGDGCPERDNDKDGIPDDNDACPRAPGDKANGGCPEYIRIEEGNLVTLNGIYFKSGEAELLPSSEGILKEVVALLKVNPQILRLNIEGHADSRGAEEFNVELSEKRAAAVQAWLTQQGIETERLDVVGYGESKPLLNNATPKGRSANRRVEFRILNDNTHYR